jgi:hypothetical protein
MRCNEGARVGCGAASTVAFSVRSRLHQEHVGGGVDALKAYLTKQNRRRLWVTARGVLGPPERNPSFSGGVIYGLVRVCEHVGGGVDALKAYGGSVWRRKALRLVTGSPCA